MYYIDIEEIKTLLSEYIEKYPLAVRYGSIYIMENDKAKADAVQLICNLFDIMM